MAVPRLRKSGGDIALAGYDSQAACPHQGFASVSDLFLMPMNQEDCRVWAISRGLSPEQLNLFVAVLAMREQLSTEDPSRSINQRPFFCNSTLDEQEKDQNREAPLMPHRVRQQQTPHPDPFFTSTVKAQPRPKAGALRTLEAVGCTPWFGGGCPPPLDADTLGVLPSARPLSSCPSSAQWQGTGAPTETSRERRRVGRGPCCADGLQARSALSAIRRNVITRRRLPSGSCAMSASVSAMVWP
jgi:hypothetical protein